MTIRDELRKAIERSNKTRYAIAKGAGVDYDVLARFIDEDRDIRLSTIDKLAAFFGLRLAKVKTHKR